MNLEESNEFIKEQDSKKRKKNTIIGLIILCIIVIIALIVMIIVLKAKESNTSKLYINGEKSNFSKTLFLTQDDVTYISAKEIARIAGYNYETGEYKKYNEDENYCYLQNEYEVVSISVDNSTIKKYLINANEIDKTSENKQEIVLENTNPQAITFTVKSSNDTMELFDLSNDVIKINDNIYVPVDDANKIFNIMLSVNGNDIYIYNLSYLYQRGVAFATNLGYDEISSIYENVRALVDNFLIVKDSKGKYGVISMADQSQILGMKYSNIKYIQNTEEFFVYTTDTVGLVDKTGKKTIIKPTEYDDLSVFDEINKLYIAQKNGVYGILDKNGDELIPVTYDSIGLTSFADFELPESETPNILEGKYIVVTDNEKFGLYTIDGKRLLKAVYENFGYLKDANDKKTGIDSVFVIPKSAGIHGLVIKQYDFYGIYDLDSKDIKIPCSFNKIYSKVESGDINYYMVSNDDTINIKDFMKEFYSSDWEEQDPEPEEFEDFEEPEESENYDDEQEYNRDDSNYDIDRDDERDDDRDIEEDDDMNYSDNEDEEYGEE